MIKAADFIGEAKRLGFTLYTGVPCSYLKPFINYVIDSTDLHYIGATNEGDAVAIASGAELAGQKSMVIFQNSGLGNAVNPLTSLNAIFKIPVLLITTLRGEPGGKADEPQHELMGQITPKLFEVMGIPWEFFPEETTKIEDYLKRAVLHMEKNKTPYAFIMKSGSVEEYELQSKPAKKRLKSAFLTGNSNLPVAGTRREEISTVQKNSESKDIIVATTGFSGRVLYALDDKPNQIYMVGSMGCASSFALGLAISQPNKRVIVLDGDGAALMRLGAFATIGYERPANLIHILLDNEVHDSTGGQSTVSHSMDLGAVAQACGYPNVVGAKTLSEIADAMAKPQNELTFIHAKIKPGESKDLPRPTITPEQVATRLREWIRNDPS